MRIYLSPSGQSHNQYYDKKHTEAEICRKIATKVKEYLDANKIENILAKPYANDAEWLARITESDKFKADLHVCIHTNAGGGHGVRILCNPTRVSERVMQDACAEIERVLPFGHKTAKIVGTSNLAEINKPAAKTVYYEIAFHDCKEECTWLVNNVDLIAKAIVKGLTGITVQDKKEMYRVQLGAYRDKTNADKLLSELKAKGFNGFIKVTVE